MRAKWGEAIVLTLVTIVWAVNFFGRWVDPDYEPLESINLIFMGIVGWRYMRRDRGESGED